MKSPRSATLSPTEGTAFAGTSNPGPLHHPMGNAAAASRLRGDTAPGGLPTSSPTSLLDELDLTSGSAAPTGSAIAVEPPQAAVHAAPTEPSLVEEPAPLSSPVEDFLNATYLADSDVEFTVEGLLPNSTPNQQDVARGAWSALPVLGPSTDVVSTLQDAPAAIADAPDVACSFLVSTEVLMQSVASIIRLGEDALDLLSVLCDVGQGAAMIFPGFADDVAIAVAGTALDGVEAVVGSAAFAVEAAGIGFAGLGTAYACARAASPALSNQERAEYAGFAALQTATAADALSECAMDACEVMLTPCEGIPLAGDVLSASLQLVIGGSLEAAIAWGTDAHATEDPGAADLPTSVDHSPQAVEGLVAQSAELDDQDALVIEQVAAHRDRSSLLDAESTAAASRAEGLSAQASSAIELRSAVEADRVALSESLPTIEAGAVDLQSTATATEALAECAAELAGFDLGLGALAEVFSTLGLGDAFGLQGAFLAAGQEAIAHSAEIDPSLAQANEVLDPSATLAGLEAGDLAVAHVDELSAMFDAEACAATTSAQELAAGAAVALDDACAAEQLSAEVDAQRGALDQEVTRQTDANLSFDAHWGDVLDQDASDPWAEADLLTDEIDAASDRIAASSGEQAALDFQVTWSARVAALASDPDWTIGAGAILSQDIADAEHEAVAA